MFKVSIICSGGEFEKLDSFPNTEIELPRIPIKGDTICYYIDNEFIISMVNDVWISVDRNNIYEYTEVYVTDYEDCYDNPVSNSLNNSMMIKKIFLDDKEYEIEITWGGNSYCFRVVGIGGFHHLPIECHTDMDKFKTLIVKAIENNHDLKEIELWDGKINDCELKEITDCEIEEITDYIFKNSFNGNIRERRIVRQEWYETECNKTGWDSHGWIFKDDGLSMSNEWNLVEYLEYLDVDKYGNPILGVAEREVEIN